MLFDFGAYKLCMEQNVKILLDAKYKAEKGAAVSGSGSGSRNLSAGRERNSNSGGANVMRFDYD